MDAPSTAEAKLSAGLKAHARGELGGAQALLESALAADPRLGRAHSALAGILIARGRHRLAVPHVEAALALDPGDASAQHCLGLLFLDRALFEPAIAAFERCLRIDPERVEAWRNLALAQRSLGRPDAAQNTIERALACVPDDAGLEDSLAALCEFLGEHERVLELLEPEAALARGSAEAVLTLSISLQALGRSPEALGLLEKGLAAVPEAERFRVEFALAGLLDREGEHERAFAHARGANAGKRARFGATAYRRHVDAIVHGFEDLRRSPPAGGGNASGRPVFIVGMPRSGTSLIEQILAAHPFVAGAGELGDIMLLAQTAGGKPRPGGMQDLSPDALGSLARAYLGTLERIDVDAARVTDKMWENFEYLGFIERLFPRARVIHCVRDPFDVAVSCYFQHFAGAGVAFSYDLAHIGAFYRQYERLMGFWRRALRLEMLDVRYEDVVGDLEGQARRAVEFLGLEWSAACLEFHASGRTVNTASYAQVRRPVYSSSVGRWRHYARHLGPFAEAAGLELAG